MNKFDVTHRPMYGFMSDEKWYEDVGHIVIGFAPMIGWLRENEQWPPASDNYPPEYNTSNPQNELYFHSSRVEDAYRDFLGYAIGDTLRTLTLIGIIIKYAFS